ncbi:cupin domain-containing protein [Coraliomargarita parva]|uniref:cupin domain-containing protein n=1 Tax=Coraliomargarita parva TaxID=3014050 RepID=UPI0022B41201|nr:cupin domain-containing protein [Coraliomargarita parva]
MEIIKIMDCQDYVAEDRAVAKEFLGPRNSGLKNLSIAYITIPPGVTVKKHYHLKSEETYHIVEGKGIMHLDGEDCAMEPGEAVAIIPGQWHSIHNPEETDLVMVVTCSPPWAEADQVFEAESE